MKCPSCGQGNVFFGDTCPNPRCHQTMRDNTQSLNQFWDKDKAGRPAREDKPAKSFFRPAWATPFKLLWLPVRLVWWLVKVPF